MQSELDWNNRVDADEEDSLAERYKWFMRPEPRDGLGPIETINDPYLGKDTPVREMDVGMTRNASEENKKKTLIYLRPFQHIRIDAAKQLQGWYKSLYEPKGVRPRPCFTEAILTEPYGGWCLVGCSFCYINSGMRGYRGSGLISAPINYGAQIKDQLKKMRRGAAGYFSSFTDPFLPLEDYYHNTQEGAEAFVKVGLPIFFLSRLRYPRWAINLLTQNPHSYAQKSINTCDPEDWRHLSPGALSLENHFSDITRIAKEGIYVSIQVNPILPGVTSNEQILKLFRKLKDVGADHVIVKFVEAGYSWAPTMVERTIKRFGARGEKFAELFTDNIGGQRTIQEAYRMNAHDMFSAYAKKIGLTFSTCYEFMYERDAEGKILNKTGVSVGRKYATSAQCHGHAVPVYHRDNENELFRPVEECPPTGCLYCASENNGKARCGDELAGEATALRFADLKIPMGQGKSRRMSLSVISDKGDCCD